MVHSCGQRSEHFLKVSFHDTMFCEVLKAGSTFWRRILRLIGTPVERQKPSDTKTQNAYEEVGYRSLKKLKWSTIERMASEYVSVMFSRNPYTRLFSGWLDKLYSPNVDHWRGIGKQILAKDKGTEGKDGRCPYNVKFSEFVSYISNQILKKVCLDSHFSPNYEDCRPCNISYTFIGKYETLKDDTFYILDYLNASQKVTFKNFESDATDDALHDAADWLFSQKQNVLNCNVSFHCATFRVWNRLRSRGVICPNEKFPFSNSDVKNLTLEYFFRTSLAASKTCSQSVKRTSKGLALSQALRSLSSGVLTKLQKAFELDFELFQYDSTISKYLISSDTTAYGYFFPDCPEME